MVNTMEIYMELIWIQSEMLFHKVTNYKFLKKIQNLTENKYFQVKCAC